MLNNEYLGVNGLFTNVLTILSFAELGIGTAIIFNMYKPVAEHDNEKIKSLMQLYKKTYTIIGIVIFLLGICVIPFMDLLVKEIPNIKENINFIYILFLTNTTVSYFFTYKKSIISANQKQSVINNIDSIFYLFRSSLLIIFLLLTRNFIVYLVIDILCTLSENIIMSKKADKMYPFLKDKNIKKLSKDESKGIFKNVKSLVIYKFGSVVMNGTDNILISMLIGVGMVGYCSNYILIIGSIKSIISSALNGITASIGNLNAVGETKQKEMVFYQITFINYIIYSLCAVIFIVLLNPFISIWLGVDNVLDMPVSIALSISFFIEGLRNSGYTYRITLGLFEKGKITPYIGAITNILFSIILCKIFGVAGIFIGTCLAQLFSYSWIDPYLIHKYEFKTSCIKYFKNYFIYFISFSIICIISIIITNMITINNIYGILIKGIIAFLICNLMNIIIFYRCSEFTQVKNRLVALLKRNSN